MSLRRIGLLLWKEFRQFRRDRLLLPIVFIMPVLQLIMFGYVVGADIEDVPTAIIDLDRTPLSRSLADAISESGYFDVVARPTSEQPLRELIDSGAAQAAVVIPEGTARRLRSGGRGEVGIVVDGSDSRIASVASGYAAQIIAQFDRERLLSQGLELEGPGIDASVRVLFNPSMRAVNAMIPGLMATILMISTASIMSQAVVRERESGTLEQMFTTPIRRGEYIVGKVTPYVIIATIQIAVVALVGRFWFRVPFYGSVGIVFLGLALFTFTTIALGLLISLVSRTRQQAQQMTMFLLIPSMVLSGFIFPIEAMPPAIVPLTYFIPLRYAIVVARSGFMKESAVADLWAPLVAMAVISIVLFTIAVLSFNRRLAD